MKIFFDTEFYTRENKIDLISIRLVRDDGAMLYLENGGFNWSEVPDDDWLQTNVVPHLAKANDLVSTEVLRRRLINFTRDIKPEFWAYYASYDWAALCMLFGGMLNLPANWPKYVMDVKQYQQTIDPDLTLPKAYQIEHHALQDAMWTKKAFHAVRERAVEMRAAGAWDL